jgi:SAM-dependent methyltransferase
LVSGDDVSSVWQRADVARAFLDERSVVLPHRQEQIEMMLAVLLAGGAPPPTQVLDLGCGSGALLGAVLAAFPAASGVGVDYSPPMLAEAREKLAPFGERAALVAADLRAPGWQAAVAGPFDAVVSGYAIHHLPDERKRALYGEIFALLAPGGAFFHAEHVSSATPELEALFDEAMARHLHARRRERGEDVTLETVRRHLLTRPDRAANLLLPVETQLAWLRDLGFTQVDCYWKWYELALFGGRRPG